MQWSVEGEAPKYVLTIRRFESKDAASKFLDKVFASFLWVGLDTSFGFEFETTETPAKFYDEPMVISDRSPYSQIARKLGWKHIDGDYDANRTTIVPEHKKLVAFGLGSVSVRMDMSLNSFADRLSVGLSNGSAPELVFRTKKLRLACEVYISSHFETSPSASFLSRIATLEILLKDTASSEPIQALVNKFEREIKEKAKQYEHESSFVKEFESAASRLAHLRSMSIKSRIRGLILEKANGDWNLGSPSDLAKEISRYYDLRSTLVHTGDVSPDSIKDANSRLQSIVPNILKVLYQEVANGSRASS